MNQNKQAIQDRKPEFIVDPVISTYTKLDDISVQLEELLGTIGKNQVSLDSILEQSRLSLEQSRSSLNQSKFILKELRDEADDGGTLRRDGTVTPTQFIIIDTHQDPGHDVKGYTVKNDGPNTIFVAHNAAISSEVDADIIDVTTKDSRFEEILPNEDIKFVFNRRRIKNIHILAQGGNSQFRVWLVW